MTRIHRHPEAAAAARYDLAIIGGGVLGIMLLLESSRRGLKALLLEEADFGGRTSFNHLRILHGGLRYLQTLDLPRFRESVAERRWFLEHFPRLVHPLPCLMPLYHGRLLKAPLPMGAALWLNDLLSRRRNDGLPAGHRIPSGRIAGREEVLELFPGARPEGLRGGALWHDAFIPHSPRLLINLIRWACRLGGTALNYMPAKGLDAGTGGTLAVKARDGVTGTAHVFTARRVVNAAGPWCREVARRLDRDQPALFRGGLLWNLLLDREPVSAAAVAVSPPGDHARMYFLLPWQGRLLAGTGHAPLNGRGSLKPRTDQIEGFLRDINAALPALALTPRDVRHVFAGLMPVKAAGSIRLTSRPVVVDHGREGGTAGLYSLCGTKFTTARSLAEKVVRRIFPGCEDPQGVVPPDDLARTRAACRGIFRREVNRSHPPPEWEAEIKTILQEESVLCLEDLVFRRTSLWTDPVVAVDLAEALARLAPWSEPFRQREVARLRQGMHPARPAFTM